MLNCFGMVDLVRLQAPLVEFLIHEAFAMRTLSNCQHSCVAYWLPAVSDDEERTRLERLLRNIQHQQGVTSNASASMLRRQLK